MKDEYLVHSPNIRVQQIKYSEQTLMSNFCCTHYIFTHHSYTGGNLMLKDKYGNTPFDRIKHFDDWINYPLFDQTTKELLRGSCQNLGKIKVWYRYPEKAICLRDTLLHITLQTPCIPRSIFSYSEEDIVHRCSLNYLGVTSPLRFESSFL